jgi:outer membrane immunogenic protein
MVLRACVGGLLLGIAGVFAVAPAKAADLPVPTKSPPAVAPVPSAPAAIYNWTGFYLGGQIGGGFAHSSWSDPFSGGRDRFNSSAGFLGGGQVGANYQWKMLVLGVEGDFSWTGLKGSGTDSLGDTLNTNTQWTSTVTGRVGAAFDRLLLYGKGGAAFARDQSSFTDVIGNSAANSFTRTGWTAGVGLEYGISKNWSAKIEYDYLGFGSQPLNFATATPTTFTSNSRLDVQEVKAGINFRFGGP